MTEQDVLIVGAGPTGLVFALWLTAQGVKVRIIDKNTGPGPTSRAMVVHARTLELYRQLDLASAVIEAGTATLRSIFGPKAGKRHEFPSLRPVRS